MGRCGVMRKGLGVRSEGDERCEEKMMRAVMRVVMKAVMRAVML